MVLCVTPVVVERQHDVHTPSSTGSGTDLDVTAEEGGAFAHAEDAPPGAAAGPWAGAAVVEDLDLESRRPASHGDLGARGARGMPKHVGQRLGQDAGDGQPERGVVGEVDVEVTCTHRDAGGPEAFHDRRKVGCDGLRGSAGPRVGAITGVERAEDALHVGQCAPPRPGELAQRLPRAVGGSVERGPGSVRQSDHDRHAVRDDVVHLAGDPCPFGGSRERGALVALARYRCVALDEVVGVLAPSARHRTGRDAQQQEPEEQEDREEPAARGERWCRELPSGIVERGQSGIAPQENLGEADVLPVPEGDRDDEEHCGERYPGRVRRPCVRHGEEREREAHPEDAKHSRGGERAEGKEGERARDHQRRRSPHGQEHGSQDGPG